MSADAGRGQAAHGAAAGRVATHPPSRSGLTVDVVVPVFNEERDIALNIPILRDFLAGSDFGHQWRIIIGDNGSDDRTPEVSEELARQHPGEIEYYRASNKGKGLLIREAWNLSTADIVAFMDVDLSTGLDAFPPLIDSIAKGRADIAIGSRLHPQAQVRRSLKRKVLTRCYNTLVRAMFRASFRDAQCGFKAARRDVAQAILPLVEDNMWFFDTEFLILAQKLRYSITEVPVTWVEDERTSVKIVGTVMSDLRGLSRLRLKRPWRNATPKALPAIQPESISSR